MTRATLFSRSTLGPGLLLRLHLPALRGCQPGQFFLARGHSAWPHILRQPLFPSSIDEETITVWENLAAGQTSSWLSAQAEGATLDVFGPLGQGLSLHHQQQRLLLVAECGRVGPLLALIGLQLDRGGSVGLLLEAPTAADLLPPAMLPPAVEYHTATADGSAGQRGDLSEIMPRALSWADAVCIAGSQPFLRRIKGQISELRFGLRRGYAQALVPATLVCGIGACLSCLTESSGRGHHRACIRGPVFDLADLAL